MHSQPHTLQLLHISKVKEDVVTQFKPRIPISRAYKENKTIERICASSTLEGCFLGHPNANYSIYVDRESVRLLEHGKKGILFRVYHFEVDSQFVYTPNELFDKSYVSDARSTNEHWITEKCEPTSVSYVLLEDVIYQKETNEYAYVYTTYKSLEEVGQYMDNVVFELMVECVRDGFYDGKEQFTSKEASGFIQEAAEYMHLSGK